MYCIKERLFMCDKCGYFAKGKTMFIKQYKRNGICLCKGCAKELENEIGEKYKEKADE